MARPDLSYLKFLIQLVIGIPCGVFTGVTGIGNSIILVPLLRWLLVLKDKSLAGTTLTIVSVSAFTGVIAYSQIGAVRWGIGVALAVCSFFGAMSADRAFSRSGATILSQRPWWGFVTLAIGLVMLGVSTQVLPPPSFSQHFYETSAMWPQLFVASALGWVLGYASRLSELGAVFMVPVLVLLLGFPMMLAVGTSVFVLLIASLPPSLLYVSRKEVDSDAALAGSIGALFGCFIGTFCTIHGLPDRLLEGIYGVVAVLLAASVLAFRPPAASKS